MNLVHSILIRARESTQGLVGAFYSIFGFQKATTDSRLSRNQLLVLSIFGLLVILALFSRFWDLGGRALHYDELLHAWYSWLFSTGSGYAHTPMTHGPFLFHVVAGAFVVFGDNEVSARFVPALFGVFAVLLPILLRRELGILGALSTSSFLLLSPTFLYFSRFLRNDIFMAVWSLLLVAVMYRYFATPKKSLLFIWVVVWAFAFTTKETTFFLALIIGIALFYSSANHFYKWIQGRATLRETPPSGVLLLTLVTISLSLWGPLSHLVFRFVGFTLVNPDSNDPNVRSGEVLRFAVETGAPVGGALFIALFIVLVLAALSIFTGFLWNKKLWIALAVCFWLIWVTLFTSFFTNSQGFFTGIWGSLGYWMAQQSVERAGQPWFYYVLGLICYEYLLLIPALLGAFYLLFKGKPFDRFLVYWSITSVFAGIYAGEKMPWLLLSQILPLSLVAGRSIGILLSSIWQNVKSDPWGWEWTSKYTSILILALSATFISFSALAILVLIRSRSFFSEAWFWIFILLALIAVSAIIWITLKQQENGRTNIQIALLGALLILSSLTLISGLRVNYSYASYERPNELLVYSQTGQESAYATECINKLAEDSGLGANLKILIGESDNFSWQWRWYLRGFDKVHYQSLKTEPLTAPPLFDVIAFSNTVRGVNQYEIVGFTKVGELNHLWWFPNHAYEDLSLKIVLRNLANRDAWNSAVDYFFSRTMKSKPYRSEGSLYVADRFAEYAIDCTTLRSADS